MAAVTEKDVVAAVAEADDHNPNAADPASDDESTALSRGGECCKDGDGACEKPPTTTQTSAERMMRFNVACAIVDLRLDTWDLIKTHFLSKPARVRDAMAAAAAAGSDGGEQPDGEFDDGDYLGLGHDPYADEDVEEDDGEEEEEGDAFVREFRQNYIKASGFDDRMKELDAIEEAYFDLDLDEESRTATNLRLWSHMEKELRDRARAVSTGKFKF